MKNIKQNNDKNSSSGKEVGAKLYQSDILHLNSNTPKIESLMIKEAQQMEKQKQQIRNYNKKIRLLKRIVYIIALFILASAFILLQFTIYLNDTDHQSRMYFGYFQSVIGFILIIYIALVGYFNTKTSIFSYSIVSLVFAVTGTLYIFFLELIKYNIHHDSSGVQPIINPKSKKWLNINYAFSFMAGTENALIFATSFIYIFMLRTINKFQSKNKFRNTNIIEYEKLQLGSLQEQLISANNNNLMEEENSRLFPSKNPVSSAQLKTQLNYDQYEGQNQKQYSYQQGINNQANKEAQPFENPQNSKKIQLQKQQQAFKNQVYHNNNQKTQNLQFQQKNIMEETSQSYCSILMEEIHSSAQQKSISDVNKIKNNNEYNSKSNNNYNEHQNENIDINQHQGSSKKTDIKKSDIMEQICNTLVITDKKLNHQDLSSSFLYNSDSPADSPLKKAISNNKRHGSTNYTQSVFQRPQKKMSLVLQSSNKNFQSVNEEEFSDNFSDGSQKVNKENNEQQTNDKHTFQSSIPQSIAPNK